jgi:hypothetical protein
VYCSTVANKKGHEALYACSFTEWSRLSAVEKVRMMRGGVTG